MSLRYAYNTNGLQNHRLEDALALVADAGYDGVALTLDIHHHDPFLPDLPGRTAALARRLEDCGLRAVVETGARFLLDPRAKHEPTLVSPDPAARARRLAFLELAVEVAAGLEAEALSFWSGALQPGVDRDHAWRWLVGGIARLAETAEQAGVVIALEPEPGMVVETIDGYYGMLEAAPTLRLALDVGHCLVTRDRDPAGAVRETAPHLGTVAIEDMRPGVHEHLPFGHGTLDLGAVLGALEGVRFDGLVCVELSRDSHRAHTLVPETLAVLRAAERDRASGAPPGSRRDGTRSAPGHPRLQA